jgi:FKBP-type peptidyl-prolyl cis-trans isomerase (trigger factor)
MALKFVDKQEIIRRAKTKGIYKIYDKFMSSMLIPKYEILESEIVGDLTEANMNYATIAYEFDQFPDIKLPNIDELQLNYEPPQVSEFEINDFVDEITKNDIVFKEKDMDATVDLDNIVFVDASYHHEGTEIKDLKKNNAPLHVIDLDVNIENNSQTFFIDNFAKQLIGHKVGQSVNVTIFYPNNDIYGFCSGKKIDVKVKINKILLIQSRPTLSNSYVYELGVGNVNNAKKLMAHAKKQIFLQKDRIIRKKLYEQIGSFINTAKVEFIPQ